MNNMDKYLVREFNLFELPCICALGLHTCAYSPEQILTGWPSNLWCENSLDNSFDVTSSLSWVNLIEIMTQDLNNYTLKQYSNTGNWKCALQYGEDWFYMPFPCPRHHGSSWPCRWSSDNRLKLYKRQNGSLPAFHLLLTLLFLLREMPPIWIPGCSHLPRPVMDCKAIASPYVIQRWSQALLPSLTPFHTQQWVMLGWGIEGWSEVKNEEH